MDKLHRQSGAEFFTPFMLWSPTDNRSMMLAHFSRHQTARDKMLSVHWNKKNSFRHMGKGSLFLLGFDHRTPECKDALFNFSEHDHTVLKHELLEQLPREIRDYMVDDNLMIESFLEKVGNQTAARNQDLFQSIQELVGAGEFQVVSNKGNIKRIDSRIQVTDKLILPAQRTFSFPFKS